MTIAFFLLYFLNKGEKNEWFPGIYENPKYKIKQSSQYTKDIEGYVFEGVDCSRLTFWTCHENRESAVHTHEYDEYLVCVHGQYKVLIEGKSITLNPGNELYIPKGTSHAGESIAGTRTIHAFGGKSAEREYK